MAIQPRPLLIAGGVGIFISLCVYLVLGAVPGAMGGAVGVPSWVKANQPDV